MTPLRIFIGWDAREAVAYHVLAHSILTRASAPVSIIPVARHHLNRPLTGPTLASVYDVLEQARDGDHECVGPPDCHVCPPALYTRPRGPLESTDFSLTRFLVPHLAGYRGIAIFMDCDMLCQADIHDLVKLVHRNPAKAVHVVQHDYTPRDGHKFLGHVQTAYPRKNWSSLMVFDLEHLGARRLTPEYVNTASGLELHRFAWLEDREIGNLPWEWNWLVGEYPSIGDAKILHYTLGGPWFKTVLETPEDDRWVRERDAMLSGADA